MDYGMKSNFPEMGQMPSTIPAEPFFHQLMENLASSAEKFRQLNTEVESRLGAILPMSQPLLAERSEEHLSGAFADTVRHFVAKINDEIRRLEAISEHLKKIV